MITWNRHTKLTRRSTLIGHIQKMKTNPNPFADEEHSLKGKTGKSHAVC